jgi:benzoyl-CoA reductase/2-hydroxyglutaryl-CoA dehydratase subunit BcrC/BadD/HgdB
LSTSAKSKALEEFKKASETIINPAIQEWRDKGGRVIGCFCSYVPEEIITAAGILSFRMRATGSTGTDEADAYLSTNNCSYARHCLSMGLRGDYDFIDGAIWLNSCDHVRRIYDNWTRKVGTPFTHLISLPRKTGEEQVIWLRGEFATLREAIEKHFGVSITDEHLWAAIRLHNETRRLQRKLYALRKAESPPITGAQILSVMVAGTAMPRERYNELLKELLEDLNQSVGYSGYRARLMVIGGILDDPAYVEVIEDQGALVVTDSSCFGSRVCWKDVDEGIKDPLTALAHYQIVDRPACPRMYGEQSRRSRFVRDMIREFKVDGVIGERIVFCDYWSGEHFLLSKQFKGDDIPFLKLDREYLLGGVGQLRTRVQAFLESIGSSSK